MAARTELFAITVPHGTSQAAPLVTALRFPDGIVQAIEFIIPPGPSGLLGWQLRYNGQPIVPRTANAFFVMDDTHEQWPVEDYPTGQGWQAATYNVDTYPHLVQFIFHVNELAGPGLGVVSLVPIG